MAKKASKKDIESRSYVVIIERTSKHRWNYSLKYREGKRSALWDTDTKGYAKTKEAAINKATDGLPRGKWASLYVSKLDETKPRKAKARLQSQGDANRRAKERVEARKKKAKKKRKTAGEKMKPHLDDNEVWRGLPSETTICDEWTMLVIDNGIRVLTYGDKCQAGGQVHVIRPDGTEVATWDVAEWEQEGEGESVMGAMLRAAAGVELLPP